MSILGADYKFVDLLEIMEDLDMNENRIRDLRNPRDAYDAVNKRYMNKRIEYKTKELEKKLTTIQTNIQQQLDDTKPFTSDLDMGNNRIINVGHPRNPEHNIEYENDAVTAKFLYDYAKIADKKYLKTDEDIDMEGHRIKGLGLPLKHNDAVPLQYVSMRVQALTDEIEKLWVRDQETAEIKNRIGRIDQEIQRIDLVLAHLAAEHSGIRDLRIEGGVRVLPP